MLTGFCIAKKAQEFINKGIETKFSFEKIDIQPGDTIPILTDRSSSNFRLQYGDGKEEV